MRRDVRRCGGGLVAVEQDAAFHQEEICSDGEEQGIQRAAGSKGETDDAVVAGDAHSRDAVSDGVGQQVEGVHPRAGKSLLDLQRGMPGKGDEHERRRLVTRTQFNHQFVAVLRVHGLDACATEFRVEFLGDAVVCQPAGEHARTGLLTRRVG